MKPNFKQIDGIGGMEHNAETDLGFETRIDPELDLGSENVVAEETDELLRIETTADIKKHRERVRQMVGESFDCLTDGVKVNVHRVLPRWCSGWQDTVELSFDENGACDMTMQDFRDQYGGEKLVLKFMDENGQYLFNKTISFNGVPPREGGKDLDPPQVRKAKEELLLEKIADRRSKSNDGSEMFQAIMNMQNQHMETIMQLMSDKKRDSDPLTQTDQMLRMMDMMDRFRGDKNSGNDGITDMLGNVLNMVGQAKSNVQPPPSASVPKPRQSPVPVPRAAAAAAPNLSNVKMPEIVSATTEECEHDTFSGAAEEAEYDMSGTDEVGQQDNETDITDELAIMSDTDLAETISELLVKIGDQRMGTIMQEFEKLSRGK